MRGPVGFLVRLDDARITGLDGEINRHHVG